MPKKERKMPDEPPLMICEECNSGYKDWEVSPENWALLPRKHRKKVLCEPCYLRILKKENHDVSKIKITHKSWKRKNSLFIKTKDFPEDMMHIHITFNDSQREAFKLPAGETMWCKLLSTTKKDLSEMVVEVQNTSLFLDLVYGDIVTATWDRQTFHGITGRPMFELKHITEKRGKRLPKPATKIITIGCAPCITTLEVPDEEDDV